MSQVRVVDSGKWVLRDPNMDMGRAERTEKHRGLPRLQPPSLAPGFGAPEPEALLSLFCPLVAADGKSSAEPRAPGGPGPVGAKCQTNIRSSFSARRTAGRLWSCSIFLKMTLGSWDSGPGLPLCPKPQPVWSGLQACSLPSDGCWLRTQQGLTKETMEALGSSSPACLRKPLHKQQGSWSLVPRFCPHSIWAATGPSPLPLGPEVHAPHSRSPEPARRSRPQLPPSLGPC